MPRDLAVTKCANERLFTSISFSCSTVSAEQREMREIEEARQAHHRMAKENEHRVAKKFGCTCVSPRALAPTRSTNRILTSEERELRAIEKARKDQQKLRKENERRAQQTLGCNKIPTPKSVPSQCDSKHKSQQVARCSNSERSSRSPLREIQLDSQPAVRSEVISQSSRLGVGIEGEAGRQEIEDLLLQSLARRRFAVKIQNVFRGFLGRGLYERTRQQLAGRASAVKIQSLFRGFLGRRLSKRARQQRLSASSLRRMCLRRDVCSRGASLERIRIRVHRSSIYEDSLGLLGQLSSAVLPIVDFIGEPALDHGGVRREWFQLLFQEMLDSAKPYFQRQASGVLWFNSVAISIDPNYCLHMRFFGCLMGQALLNGIPIHVPFPELFFTEILKQEDQDIDYFTALRFLDPELQRTLARMCRNTEELEALDLTMIYEDTDLAMLGWPCEDYPLVPGGGSVPVTAENSKLYVHLWSRRRLLSPGVERALTALRAGFFAVVPQDLLRGVAANDLSYLMCGEQFIDGEDIAQHTSIVGLLTPFEESMIKEYYRLWLRCISHGQLEKYLVFVTALRRLPMGGAKELVPRLQLNVDKSLPVCNLPVAHTCSNRVDIPFYCSSEQMSQRFDVALRVTSEVGFGMV